MKNELQKHKTSDKIKWIITGVALILAFVFLAGLCMQLFGNDKFKPSNWFKKTECVHIDEDTDGKCDECGKDMPIDNGEVITGADKPVNGELSVTPMSTKTMCLTASPLIANVDEDNYVSPDVSTYADTNSYTITATITPSDATNKKVDYSIAWKNPSSTWASGKTVTSYVTVTPSSDGALTATVTCKQAFAEQAIVTVTSRDNSSVTATCTVDYKQRITSLPLTLAWSSTTYGSTTPITFDSSTTVTADYLGNPVVSSVFESWSQGVDVASSCYSWSFGFGTSIGSKQIYREDFSPKIEVAATSAYLTALDNAGLTTKVTAEQFVTVSKASYGDMFLRSFTSKFFSSITAYNNFKSALRSQTSTDMIRVRISAMDGNIVAYTKTYNVRFSSASLMNNVTGLTVGSAVVF